MYLLRNVFAIIGILFLIATLLLIWLFEPYISKIRSLDRKAVPVYVNLAQNLLEHGDATLALVYRQEVRAEWSEDKVRTVLLETANELGLPSIGFLDPHEEIARQTQSVFPPLSTFLFCDPVLVADLIRHNVAMAAFFPCRVTLYRDARGVLWLITPNLDFVMHGGRPLPVLLQERSTGIQEKLRELVDRGAGIPRDSFIGDTPHSHLQE